MEIILDRVETQVRKYCILPTEHHYVAATLLPAATHVADIAHTATRGVIKAPEKRCGKSRLLEVLMCLSWNPESLVDVTKAALVTLITQGAGITIFADECDEWLPKGGPLVGILNAGHQRGKYRTIMENGHPVRQETFAFAFLAGIGSFPGTIEDRAIVFNMKRRGPGEKVSPFRLLRDQGPLVTLGAELHAELRDRLDDLRVIEPENPLEDRAADNWDLLLMIAELFTPANQAHNPQSWAYRAREAAVALTDEAAELQEETRSHKLLIALRSMFKMSRTDKLSSVDICERLAKSDPETWVDFGTMQLASTLEPYGLRPKVLKMKDGTARGYTRAMFADTFARYLQPEEPDTDLKVV